MIVHFICSGNAFRSRLAEAYLKSLKIPGIEVMSSGSNSKRNHYHNLMPYTSLLLEKHKLTQYASKAKIQLTQERLNLGDITICVNRKIYQEIQARNLKIPPHTFVWDITDMNQLSPTEKTELTHEILPPLAESTFRKIQKHVDELVSVIKRPKPKEMLDVLDSLGRPTGKVSDIYTVHAEGLIHGGVHVGLYTGNGLVVLEKRSSNIIFNPGLWDISMGGFISSKEIPEAALIREVFEELGVILRPSQIKKLFVYEYDHYLPHYGFHNHNFTHTYIAEIPISTKFTLQVSEVAEAKFVSLEEARDMNEHNKRTIGMMVPTHAYNARILNAIEQAL